mmetsp:Transcript_67646/g.218478  ORF Transcript_67646/g.218478 Transcript_67646/m.218478 type:complete len:281 (+) Transcript_67646:191-1033(+)
MRMTSYAGVWRPWRTTVWSPLPRQNRSATATTGLRTFLRRKILNTCLTPTATTRQGEAPDVTSHTGVRRSSEGTVVMLAPHRTVALALSRAASGVHTAVAPGATSGRAASRSAVFTGRVRQSIPTSTRAEMRGTKSAAGSALGSTGAGSRRSSMPRRMPPHCLSTGRPRRRGKTSRRGRWAATGAAASTPSRGSRRARQLRGLIPPSPIAVVAAGAAVASGAAARAAAALGRRASTPGAAAPAAAAGRSSVAGQKAAAPHTAPGSVRSNAAKARYASSTS